MNSLLPVALVTGFLGAGKTTFMRHLLGDAKSRGLKVGVVINEFGVADIDGEILRQSGAEMLGTLAGGCACCSSQDEMIWTMLELGRQKNRPDAVLLEASGLADPLVMLDGLTVAALLPLVRVASVVSVVDALRLPELKDETGRLSPLLQRQIALADLIIANKSDLAFRGDSTKNERKVEAETILRGINSGARLEFARGGAIDLEEFWARVLNSENAVQAPQAGAAIHGHAQTFIVPMKKPIARETLEDSLRKLGENVWRVKGFVRLQGENDMFLVQWSGSGAHFAIERFELHNLKALPPAELVFIGPALDQSALWRDFNGAAPLV